METRPQLKVSSDSLVKPGIKPAKWFIHYNMVAPDLGGNIYCILNVTNFLFGNDILVSFDKKGQHSKLRMYTQRTRNGI